MRALIVLTFILACSVAALAQLQQPIAARQAEMKKVEKLVGIWRGSGWIQQGPKRETFSGTETVQRKIDGLAILVEGKFKNAEDKVIHETLAVVAFDEKLSSYRFRAYLASGGTGEYDLKITPEGYVWGFDVQGGTIRYTIKADNDVWFETGEFSRDGKAWMRVFEMKLDKVK